MTMPDATTDATTPATPALDLDAIDALANAAMLGPWTFVEDEDGVAVVNGDDFIIMGTECGESHRVTKADMRFCAAARTLIPQLVTALRSARQDAKRLDWLENHPMVIPMSHDTRGWLVRDKRYGWEHSASILRDAIDTAITEEAGR